MTRIEIIKMLLNRNLNQIMYNDLSAPLKILFKGDKFIIVNSYYNKPIYSDYVLKYDLDYESQKSFVFNIIKKFYKFVRDEETMNYKIIYENWEEKKCKAIVSDKKFMYANYFIDINKSGLRICKNVNSRDCLDCLDILSEKLYYYINSARYELFYCNESGSEKIYINFTINKKNIAISYVDDDEYLFYNNLGNFVKEKDTVIYYSYIDENEFLKNIDYIKRYLYDYISAYCGGNENFKLQRLY